MSLFDYPKRAVFARMVPKIKIYEHTSPSSSLKRCFISQVNQIVWEYKLAPETVNLPHTRSVPELQIFKIFLKESALKHDVLHCIDKAIPFPIIFELCFEDKTKVIAAHKRPSLADSSKWVVSDYFETAWLPSNTVRTPLPMVLDLEMLYAHLLNHLMPFPARPGEVLQAHVERMESIHTHQREIEKCHSRLRKEKQFANKVMINAELRVLKQEFEKLTRSVAVVRQ